MFLRILFSPKVFMKTSFKVLGAIMALGLVILLGLHLFLQYGLTKAMRDVVLDHRAKIF